MARLLFFLTFLLVAGCSKSDYRVITEEPNIFIEPSGLAIVFNNQKYNFGPISSRKHALSEFDLQRPGFRRSDSVCVDFGDIAFLASVNVPTKMECGDFRLDSKNNDGNSITVSAFAEDYGEKRLIYSYVVKQGKIQKITFYGRLTNGQPDIPTVYSRVEEKLHER